VVFSIETVKASHFTLDVNFQTETVTYKLNQGSLDYGIVMELAITECCIMHMEYVSKGDRLANSHLMNWCLANGAKSCFSPA